MRQRLDMVQCFATPAHRLMQGTCRGVLLARGMPGAPGKPHQYRTDAAMRQHRFAHGRLGHQHRIVRHATRQKRCDTARIVGFFVRGKHKRRITVAGIGRRHQRRRRTLDIADTQADHTVFGASHHVWISTPVRRIRHGIQMHVEQVLRRAAHRVQAHRPCTVIDHLDLEPRQLRAQIIEDAALRGNRTRRIAGVEGHQRLQVVERGGEQVRHVCQAAVVVVR